MQFVLESSRELFIPELSIDRTSIDGKFRDKKVFRRLNTNCIVVLFAIYYWSHLLYSYNKHALKCVHEISFTVKLTFGYKSLWLLSLLELTQKWDTQHVLTRAEWLFVSCCNAISSYCRFQVFLHVSSPSQCSLSPETSSCQHCQLYRSVCSLSQTLLNLQGICLFPFPLWDGFLCLVFSLSFCVVPPMFSLSACSSCWWNVI